MKLVSPQSGKKFEISVTDFLSHFCVEKCLNFPSLGRRAPVIRNHLFSTLE